MDYDTKNKYCGEKKKQIRQGNIGYKNTSIYNYSKIIIK